MGAFCGWIAGLANQGLPVARLGPSLENEVSQARRTTPCSRVLFSFKELLSWFFDESAWHLVVEVRS